MITNLPRGANSPPAAENLTNLNLRRRLAAEGKNAYFDEMRIAMSSPPRNRIGKRRQIPHPIIPHTPDRVHGILKTVAGTPIVAAEPGTRMKII